MRTKLFLGCALFLYLHAVAVAQPAPIDSIAAVVNDSVITRSDLAQNVKLIEAQMKQSGNSLPPRAALEKQVMEHLILNEIQLQLAKKTGIHVDDTALDNAVANIAQQNRLSVSELREALSAEGLDFAHYRHNLHHQMLISQLQQRDVMQDIQVSEQEILQFLHAPNGLGEMVTEYRLGHILIPLSESPSPEELTQVTQKADRVIADLKAGKAFSDVAITDSTGEQALQGGDLGWRKLAELPTIFVKIAPTLQLQQIPAPIRSSSGLHVIKLLDKRSLSHTQASIDKTLVRHILIKTNTGASDNEAKQRLTLLRDKILQGEDFAHIAKGHSADLGSASQGGSLGWVSDDALVPEFSKVMNTIALNALSEPFKTPFGWHILQVTDRKALSEDGSAMRQKAKKMIQQRKFEEKLASWSRELRDEAYVKAYDLPASPEQAQEPAREPA